MRFQTMLFVMLMMAILVGCGDSPSDSGDEGDTTPPSVPEGIEGTSGDEMIELIWEANSEDDLAGYNLYRSEESFSDVSDMSPVNRILISDIEFTDENLQNGITYYYRLTAMDENNNESNPSSELEITSFSDPPDRPKR